MKLKIKIAAKVFLLALGAILFTVLLPIAVTLYVAFILSEWYIDFWSGYINRGRGLLIKYDEQWEGKQ